MQYETGNIVKFLQTLPDDRLAALQAHCEDGKLAFASCCCLVGSVTAKHALYGAGGYCDAFGANHLDVARGMPFAFGAELEFQALGLYDSDRRERLLPLLLAEQDRRAQSSTAILDSREAIEVA